MRTFNTILLEFLYHSKFIKYRPNNLSIGSEFKPNSEVNLSGVPDKIEVRDRPRLAEES